MAQQQILSVKNKRQHAAEKHELQIKMEPTKPAEFCRLLQRHHHQAL